MTYTNNPTPNEPQLMQRDARWNGLAIAALVIPLAVFILAQVVSRLIGTAGGGNANLTAEEVSQTLTSGTIFVAVELALYIVGVVVGHLSLRAKYRNLRGRGMGIAGVILSYIGVALSILGLVAIIVLPILISNNPEMFANA